MKFDDIHLEFIPKVFWGISQCREGWWLDLRPINRKLEPIWGPAIHETEEQIIKQMSTERNRLLGPDGLWNGPINFQPTEYQKK